MKRWMGWLSMFQTALLMIFHKDNSCYAIIMKGQKAVAGLETTGRGDLELNEAPHYSFFDKADDSASVTNLCEM